MTAARHGNLAIVERLLSAKAPPDDRDSVCLSFEWWLRHVSSQYDFPHLLGLLSPVRFYGPDMGGTERSEP